MGMQPTLRPSQPQASPGQHAETHRCSFQEAHLVSPVKTMHLGEDGK